MEKVFNRLANSVAHAAGRPWAFALSLASVIVFACEPLEAVNRASNIFRKWAATTSRRGAAEYAEERMADIFEPPPRMMGAAMPKRPGRPLLHGPAGLASRLLNRRCLKGSKRPA